MHLLFHNNHFNKFLQFYAILWILAPQLSIILCNFMNLFDYIVWEKLLRLFYARMAFLMILSCVGALFWGATVSKMDSLTEMWFQLIRYIEMKIFRGLQKVFEDIPLVWPYPSGAFFRNIGISSHLIPLNISDTFSYCLSKLLETKLIQTMKS